MLSERIKKYAGRNPARFHTPGHKGEFDPLDVTELFFTDNLYSPDPGLRLILELEERAARVFFGARDIRTSISCGGATLGIQAALLAAVRANGGRKLVCARDCHVSLVNALALLELEPVWTHGPENISGMLDGHTAAVFVTSPSYYGEMRSIREIARACREHGVPLIIDNAHGPHLAFHAGGGLHPINCGAGADMIVIDSVHKTLPALTGAALVHAAPLFDIRGAMRVFGSTSPSYLILQSIERMLDMLEAHGEAEHARLLADIARFVPGRAPADDPFRIILPCRNQGERLYFFLFERGVACEFYERDRVILIPSILNKTRDFKMLADALRDFDAPLTAAQGGSPAAPYTPPRAMSLSGALKRPRELVPAVAAPGRVCAEPVFAYPPGVPIVLPGELIDGRVLVSVKKAHIREIYCIK